MRVTPEALDVTSCDLTNITTTLTEATTTAVAHTAAILSAGADEISQAITAVFNTYGQDWQTLTTHAEASYQWFVQNLAAAARVYQDTERLNRKAISPLPIGDGENIYRIEVGSNDVQIAIGGELLTVQWNWQNT